MQHAALERPLDEDYAAVSVKCMNTSRAALASLCLLLLSRSALAEDAPVAEAAPVGTTLASITPQPRPDPRDDAAPTGFRSPLAPAAAALPSPLLRGRSDQAAEAPASEHEGALGALRIGALAGAGFPSAVSGQIVLKLAGWVGATASYGATPSVSVPVAPGTTLSQRGFSATARVYPFRGAFFVGVGGGQSVVSSQSSATTQGAYAQNRMQATTAYVVPELGLLHRFSFGLAIGADVGVQIPVASHSATTSSLNGSIASTPSELRDAMAFVATKPIPVLNFLRLGYVL